MMTSLVADGPCLLENEVAAATVNGYDLQHATKVTDKSPCFKVQEDGKVRGRDQGEILYEVTAVVFSPERVLREEEELQWLQA